MSFLQQGLNCIPTPIDHEIQELEDLLGCPSIFRDSALYPGNLDLHGTEHDHFFFFRFSNTQFILLTASICMSTTGIEKDTNAYSPAMA